MRILQVLPELNVGGVETGTIDLARYLTARKIYNIVVSHGGRMVPELEKIGVRHYSLPVHRKSLFSIIRCVRVLQDIIRKEKITVVHARSRIPAWIAYFACRRTQAVLVTTCHGYYSRHFLSRVMGWPKRVIVPSEIIGRHMIDDFGVPVENIRYIPRGVDLKRFRLTQKDIQAKSQYVIANVGRLTPIKGHVFFLKSMAKVIRSMPYVKIWIIGDAAPHKENYRYELEMLVKRLGLSEHVTFWGHRSDVPQLLSQSDVLVLSSVKPESFGRVITEAQAAGVPVVATDVGGFAEVVDHERTGLLVMPKDTDAMAQATLRILNDQKLARQLVDGARQKLEREFTVERMCEKTCAVYEESLRAYHILVIKISSLGDVVLSTAALKALRTKFPKAKIFCLVGQASRKILQHCPYINELLVIDPQHKERGLLALLKFARKLRACRFDKIVDFQNNNKSHLLAFLSFPRESYGFRNRKLGFLLSAPVIRPRHTCPPVEHQFQILQMLGINYRPQMRLELWPTQRDQRKVQQLLESQWVSERMVLVGLHLSASRRWETKNWPLAHMAALCDLLAAHNMRAILTGAASERSAAQRLVAMTKVRPVDLVGKTDIMELAAVIKKCRVFITPDSAPLHMAAALRVPFIALFGPTDSARHLPPADDFIVLEKKPPCAPCYRPRCRILSHACLQSISPEEVMQGVQQLIMRKR